MPSRSNKEERKKSQGAERRTRFDSLKVTPEEAAANPREKGRAGLTRLNTPTRGTVEVEERRKR